MRSTFVLLVALAVTSTLVGCASSDEPRFTASRASAQDRESAPRRRAAPSATPAPTPPPAPMPAPAPSGAVDPQLLNPSALTRRAPETFAVQFDTTEGPITIDVHRAWSPNGADRFYNLVMAGYYTDVAFFRVVRGFMAQVGINGQPEVNRVWQRAQFPDDPPAGQHNTRGMVSFATGGPNSRTTQFFINFGDNSRLDSMGFTPFGLVRDMAPVDHLYDVYGEGAPSGRGPQQGRIQSEGNTYLHADFPELDYIRSARVL